MFTEIKQRMLGQLDPRNVSSITAAISDKAGDHVFFQFWKRRHCLSENKMNIL